MCCHLSDYVVLGEAMSTSAKIMGIRFNSLFLSVRRKPLSLKKLATEAANKIIEQKSSGKINLIGYSAAGLLAYETAKALQEHGHEINSLILIDSDPTFKKLKWPILLPKKIERHFIRGYFDGDGSIFKTKQGYWGITIASASNSFIKSLQIKLKESSIESNIGKGKGCEILRVKTESYKDFYEYLYNLTNVKLDRKENKFNEMWD